MSNTPNEQAMSQQPTGIFHIATAIGLRGEPARAHAQKAQQPIDDIEDHAAHGNGAHGLGRTKMSHDG